MEANLAHQLRVVEERVRMARHDDIAIGPPAAGRAEPGRRDGRSSWTTCYASSPSSASLVSRARVSADLVVSALFCPRISTDAPWQKSTT